jgi:tRNA threonylcarbamoyladenosine biosynthesis protein TsaB
MWDRRPRLSTGAANAAPAQPGRLCHMSGDLDPDPKGLLAVLVLGIETAADPAGLALLEGDDLLAQQIVEARGELVRRLIPTLGALLGQAGKRLDDLGLIAVGRGPGSFTGLRIGMATAKGLAQARGLPIVGVPTLAACAWPMSAFSAGVLCPVLRSRRDFVYAAIFRARRPVTDDLHLRAGELADRLNALGEPVLMGGHARALWNDLFEGRFQVEVGLMPEHVALPSAEGVARLGAETFTHQGPDDVLTLAPVYLRPPGITQPRDKTILGQEPPERG